MKTIHIILFLFVAVSSIQASEVVKIQALTDQIIYIHFDDGEVVLHDELGQNNNDDYAIQDPLDVAAASSHLSYSIFCAEDANYSNARHPEKVSRFSRGTEFSGNEANFEVVREHELYLTVPDNLQGGLNYEITISGLGAADQSFVLKFDPFSNQSDLIHLNQIGFLPNAGMKFGYLGKFIGSLAGNTPSGFSLDEYADSEFYLVDESNSQVVFTGTINKRYDLETDPAQDAYGNDYYGSDIWECDFSSFATAGNYHLVVERVGRSATFEINADIYHEVFYDVARAIYHQRCGIELKEEHTEFHRPLCHHHDLPNYQVEYSETYYMYGGNQFEALPANSTGQAMPMAQGRYHDAADWDSGASHIIVSNYLNLAYQINPGGYNDGQLNIPESGNGIPDILDEAKFGLDFFRKLKGPTGGICGGVEETGHPLFGDVSYLDEMSWYAYAEESKATYNTSAAICLLALSYESMGNSDSTAALLAEAETLLQWADDNANSNDEQLLYSSRLMANAALYSLSGKDIYQDEYKNLISQLSNFIQYPENDIHLHMSQFIYARADHDNRDQDAQEQVIQDFLSYTDFTSINPMEYKAFRFANNPFRPVRYGGASTPFATMLIYAYVLTGNEMYRNYALTTLDYYLGGNMLNLSWFSGIGHNSLKQYMHLDSFVDGKDETIPGYNTYGPWHLPDNWGWFTFPTHGYTDSEPGHGAIPATIANFENRYCPGTAEFTVQEQLAPNTFAMGFFLSELPETTTDIDELEVPNLEFYPNPVDDLITVMGNSTTAESETYEITDLSGRVIQRGVIKSNRVSTAGLSGGFYLLNVLSESAEVLASGKFIKN